MNKEGFCSSNLSQLSQKTIGGMIVNYMKIKVITSYKPGSWEIYAKKGIESMAQQFPKEIDIVVYAEEPKPKCNYDR